MPRPSSARPRRTRKVRKGPSRVRDGLRSKVDQSRMQEMEERVRQGMFSFGNKAANRNRIHVHTVKGRRRRTQSSSSSRRDLSSGGRLQASRFRPQSARVRRDVSPLYVRTSTEEIRGYSQSRSRRRQRPRSARQERPFSPIAEMAASSRLSPIHSFRDDGNPDDHAYSTYSEFEDDEVQVQITEESKQRQTTRSRPQTSRRMRKSQSKSLRKSKSRPSTAANILRYSDSEDGFGTEDDTSGQRLQYNGNVASPNTRSALARSEDLLERARAYLLNRQGLNSNTRKFLEEKELALMRGSGKSRHARNRGRHRRKRRIRPASAGRHHPSREKQFAIGEGRMVAAAHGRLVSSADYDNFGLDELESDIRQCLLGTQGVVEVSRLKVKKLRKGHGVHVSVHISVDSGTSVMEAHEIATDARKSVFDVDSCIDDATVHVDAQPAKNPTERQLDESSAASPDQHVALKREVHYSLAQIRDIYRVSRVNIKRDGGETLAQVEILVNPELRIRRVHAVARRARELVETVPGIDKADVHLELDDGSKKDQDLIEDQDFSSEATYSRDGDDDLIDSAISPAKMEMNRPSRRFGILEDSSPSEQSFAASELGAPETESLSYSARSHIVEESQPQPAPTPQLLFGKATVTPNATTSKSHNETVSSSSPSARKGNGVSTTGSPKKSSLKRPLSAHKRKRNKRVHAIASDATVAPCLSRVNQHIMQSVLYKRFKYENKLISVGTHLSDADAQGRGFIPAVPDFVQCVLNNELDLGLSAREGEKLATSLAKFSSRAGQENVVRYGDFVEALRYLQRKTEEQEEKSQEEDGFRGGTTSGSSAISENVTSVFSVDSVTASSPSQTNVAINNKAIAHPRALHLQQSTSENIRKTAAMTPEQLTSAEAARKEMEKKMLDLKDAQEAELQKMRDELQMQKEATEKERLALEASKREHEELIKAEKEAMAQRKQKEEEREQRERLKREWLAREQAQQKRAKLEKERKEKEDRLKEERMSKEALRITEEQTRLAIEKEKWEQQKQYDEEQAKLRKERAEAQKAAEIERLEREKLASQLVEKERELVERRLALEEQRSKMKEKGAELEELKRMREMETADFKRKLELEARQKALIEKEARSREEQEIDRLKKESEERRMEEENQRKAKEAELRAKVAHLEKARADDLRKSKEEAVMEADKARLAFEAELAQKSQEIASKLKEMEDKVLAEKRKAEQAAEEAAKLAKEAEDAKNMNRLIKDETQAALQARQISADAIISAERAKLKEAHDKEILELRATLASEKGAREKAAAIADEAKEAALLAAEREKAAKEEAELVRKEAERKRKAAEDALKKEISDAQLAASQEARSAAEAEIALVRREAEETIRKVKEDAAQEARRLKEEAMAQLREQHHTMISPTTKLVFDPEQGEEIPQWSKIWDPRSQAYYYQDNFTGETSWDPHSAQWSAEDGNHIYEAEPIPRDTPVKTKSPYMNRTVAARRIQCAFRGKIGRKLCREQRGRTHASLRQSIVEDHIASSPKHIRDSNLLQLPASEQRWMKVDDPYIRSEYWYDTEKDQVSWNPPSASEIKEHEDKLAKLSKLPSTTVVDPLEESTDSLGKSMSLRERRELEAALKEAKEVERGTSKSVNKRKKKNKLRRKLSIDTDTALQPMGTVKPYESPENSNNVNSNTDNDTSAYDGGSSSNNILNENNTERSSNQSIHMSMTNTERSMGGGATERELASGDVFPDYDVDLPMRTNLNQNTSTMSGAQPTWEALTTPMGRHIYWYDWSRGVSQWEKPTEVAQLSDSQLGHRVMPPTPKQGSGPGSNGASKGTDKAAELWGLLKKRSQTVATSIQSGWKELRDDRTGEHFFHNEQRALFQWEKPAEWVDENHIGGAGLHGGWQMVATPLGRSLYYYNESTGSSQWERPAEMGDPSGANESDIKRQAMRLASTPKSSSDAEKSAAAKLWVVLALRSTRVQVIGDWHEFYDPMTKETFYHNVEADEYCWERPKAMEHIDPVIVVDSSKLPSGQKLENAPAHIPRPKIKKAVVGSSGDNAPKKSNTPVQVWEPVATPKGKHLYYWNSETGESKWEKPTETTPNAKISPSQKRVLRSPDTMAQLQESSEMWAQMRTHAIIEYIQGDWQCLLEHTTNQRFYHDTSTGKHQWEPPQLHGEWIPAGGQNTMAVATKQAKQPEVWHEVRTPKGKNLYFFEANSGRSEWTLPPGVSPVKEQGHLPPSTPKSGGGFGFDATNTADSGVATSVEPQAAAKMWQVLRARSKQVRHNGDWSELLDEASNEVFYHNSRDGTFTWECPAALKIGQSGTANNSGAGGDYSITL